MAKIDYAGTIAAGDSTNLVAGSIGIDLTTSNLFVSNGTTWIQTGVNGAPYAHLATTIAGEDTTRDVLKTVESYGYEVHSAASTVTLGTTGASGDTLHRIRIPTNFAGNLTILDGLTSILVLTAPAAGDYVFNIRANSYWSVTHSAAETALYIGKFT